MKTWRQQNNSTQRPGNAASPSSSSRSSSAPAHTSANSQQSGQKHKDVNMNTAEANVKLDDGKKDNQRG
jgi:hypothetical protein